jgi:hypothetical protein
LQGQSEKELDQRADHGLGKVNAFGSAIPGANPITAGSRNCSCSQSREYWRGCGGVCPKRYTLTTRINGYDTRESTIAKVLDCHGAVGSGWKSESTPRKIQSGSSTESSGIFVKPAPARRCPECDLQAHDSLTEGLEGSENLSPSTQTAGCRITTLWMHLN